ncbi:MAG: DNA-processing protein DprA, partial [Anaerolineaceae bacterium]|nr:DNA-processing protein DprA [Anaerolineaceae bacterium]
MHPKAYWVGLNIVKGIGSVRMQALLDHFGDPQQVWNAPEAAIRATGLHPRIVENLLQVRRDVDLESCWKQIEALGISVLTRDEEAYPARLKEIEQPPPVLYVRGEIQPADELAVAIVGTRR